jgi:prephenate dehydrogenase
MTVNFTIIGLGQIGASIGLGLADQKDKILRSGHDPEPTLAKKMQKEGAVDRIFFNLPESVREADVVILALPVGQVEDTLKYIAEDLREGAVVIDTSPIHAGVIALAKKYLSANRHFVSVYPVVSPLYIEEYSTDAGKPHADLFEKSEFLVAAEKTTHPEALKLVEDLASLLKAKIYISDPVEADGISARVELLPRLVSAAFVHSTIDQAGWNDNRRSAGKSYASIASVISHIADQDNPGGEFLLNKENSLSAIDQIISSLQELRQMISDDEKDRLNKLIKKAHLDHAKWLEQRTSGDWEKYIGEKPPSTKERLGGLFGIRDRKKKNQ